MKKEEDIQTGRRIKEIRSYLKMDQKTFANRINATVSALSNWENGRNKPNDIMLREIATLGGTTTRYLLTGKESTKELLERSNTLGIREVSVWEAILAKVESQNIELFDYLKPILSEDVSLSSDETLVLLQIFKLFSSINNSDLSDMKQHDLSNFIKNLLIILENRISNKDTDNFYVTNFEAILEEVSASL